MAAADLTVTVRVRIPRWKRALIGLCVWALNSVVRSLPNDVEIL